MGDIAGPEQVSGLDLNFGKVISWTKNGIERQWWEQGDQFRSPALQANERFTSGFVIYETAFQISFEGKAMEGSNDTWDWHGENG